MSKTDMLMVALMVGSVFSIPLMSIILPPYLKKINTWLSKFINKFIEINIIEEDA